MSSAPLKATSLSALRDLQRQASKQSALKPHTGHASETRPDTPEDASTSVAPPKRRPHRFLPPGSGTRTSTRTPGEANTSRVAPSHPHSTRRPSVHPEVSGSAQQPPRPPLHTGSGMAPDEPEHALHPDDIALFRRVVQSVTPALQSNRVMMPPVTAATSAQLQQRRQHAMGQRVTATLDVSDHYASASIDHDDTLFLQAGQGPHLIKALKKGKWPIEASLDLHGATLDDARERMDRFMQACRDHHLRCVRIVHGKGHGSKDGDPVLKETVRRWLSQLAVVQAYIECSEPDGGAGAVLVLLSKYTP